MKQTRPMRTLVLLSVLLFPLVGFSSFAAYLQQVVPPAQRLPVRQASGTEKLTPDVLATMQSLQPGDMLSVIVTLNEQADLNKLAVTGVSRAARQKGVVDTLRAKADTSQRALKRWFSTRQSQKDVAEVTYFWIFNGLAITATPVVIMELAARPEVQRISLNETIQAPPPPEQAQLGIASSQSNLTLINIPALWNLDLHGQGIVVANMDTGVDGNHPDLGPKWRGGTNSWFDPSGQHPLTPTDLAGASTGHGTETMGVMVGGEDGGVAFGIAPQATWIAVKVFKDNGTATTANFHAGFQWLLDPDGNPNTPDAPDVVNASWTSTNPNVCNLEFQADLQALRTAGILPVFAAGNFGSAAFTSASPGNNPAAFAVGAINNFNIIRGDSSRGPRPASTPCDDGTVYPELVAPGTNIHTTYLTPTNYTNVSGTSLAAPHLAGGLALLLEAAPGLTANQQETALLNSVVDLGASGPDNTYGNGRVDFLAAYQSLFDLAVTQTVLTRTIVSSPLTYTLVISNGGPLTATQVTLSDSLPPQVTVGAVAFSQGNCIGTTSVVCNLGNLSHGTAATVTLRVTPTQAGLITNTITVTGIKPDLNSANDMSVASTKIIGQVFLPVVIK